MTAKELNIERAKLALSELEEALDYFDNDEAFALYAVFEKDLMALLNRDPRE